VRTNGATLRAMTGRREVMYKLCKSCGQPVLKKGQVRKNPHDYRHARGCPNDDVKSPVIKTAAQLDAETRAMGFFAPGGRR
jgi:hypothetical protein